MVKEKGEFAERFFTQRKKIKKAGAPVSDGREGGGNSPLSREKNAWRLRGNLLERAQLG